MRRTKIVATIGPACETEEQIEALIEAGVDVFRFNMKHGDTRWHSVMMNRLETVSQKIGRRVATLIDLQGPEVRVERLPHEPFKLTEGESFWFVKRGVDLNGVVLDHNQVIDLVKIGMTVLADDGFLEFKVVEKNENGFRVVVVGGEELKNRKTVNFPGLSFDFPCLVDKDVELLSMGAKHTVDYVALSFVRSAKDIRELRQEMERLKIEADIIAKIEHPDAVEKFEEILEIADGIMVARGDLGIEYPIEEVPLLQKRIVKRSREVGKPVIVATQMLESMIYNSRPTRAEVSDVANAVYDRADAVMLSGETAAGKYPQRAVKMMALVARKTERAMQDLGEIKREEVGVDNQEKALVVAANRLAMAYGEGDKKIKAIVALTESGKTAQLLSQLRPGCQILALSKEKKVLDRLKLIWGVEPVDYQYTKNELTNSIEVVKSLRDKRYLKEGEKVVVIYGERWGRSGQTSVVRLQEV